MSERSVQLGRTFASENYTQDSEDLGIFFESDISGRQLVEIDQNNLIHPVTVRQDLQRD